MRKTKERKKDVFKLHYWDSAVLTGKYRFPKINAVQAIPHHVISFNERSSIQKPRNHWIDFFIDDYQFECFWNIPSRY